IAGDDDEPQGAFVHGLFRDVMAAEYLARASISPDWETKFKQLEIWKDLAADGKRWREAMGILLAVYALSPNYARGAKVVLGEFRKQLAAAKNASAKRTLLSVLLSAPAQNFQQLFDDPDAA